MLAGCEGAPNSLVESRPKDLAKHLLLANLEGARHVGRLVRLPSVLSLLFRYFIDARSSVRREQLVVNVPRLPPYEEDKEENTPGQTHEESFATKMIHVEDRMGEHQHEHAHRKTGGGDLGEIMNRTVLEIIFMPRLVLVPMLE